MSVTHLRSRFVDTTGFEGLVDVTGSSFVAGALPYYGADGLTRGDGLLRQIDGELRATLTDPAKRGLVVTLAAAQVAAGIEVRSAAGAVVASLGPAGLTGNLAGDVTGDLTGNSAGIHTGPVVGDSTGLHTGNVVGNVTGNLTGDSAGTHTGPVVGNVTGNVTGNLTGDSTGLHTGAVVGNVTGDLTGHITAGASGHIRMTGGNVGIGSTNPQNVLDLGTGTEGRAIAWGGPTGAAYYNSIGSNYSNAALMLLHGLKPSTAANAVLYSLATMARAGIRIGNFADGDIVFASEASELKVVGDVFDFDANTKMTLKRAGQLQLPVTGAAGGLLLGGDATLYRSGPNALQTGGTFAATGFIGPLTGNVTGNVTGDSAGTHTGAVVGNVTGNLTGEITGNTRIRIHGSFGFSASDYVGVGANVSFTGTSDTWTYTLADAAAFLQFYLGGFRFFTAAAGTAGAALPLVQRMYLNQAGNLGLGRNPEVNHTLAVAGSGMFSNAPAATANYGLLNLGPGPFDGATAGFFAGHASGTGLAINAASGFAGRLIDAQIAGVRSFSVDADGSARVGPREGWKPTRFGFSAEYRVLLLGSTGVTAATDAVTLALGVDPMTVAGGQFLGNGREILLRDWATFSQPNAAGTDWVHPLALYRGDVGVGIAIGIQPAARLHVAGNRSQAAWGVAGVGVRVDGVTYTDTSTLAAGTAASAVGNSFAIPTLAAGNAGVTITDAGTVYIAGPPAAGANVTITNPYSLWVASGAIKLGEGVGFALGTATGTKIGTSATQKLGLWNATPVVQPAAIANPAGGATVDTECRAALASLLAAVRLWGGIAP